jgi:hypothetical protein
MGSFPILTYNILLLSFSRGLNSQSKPPKKTRKKERKKKEKASTSIDPKP